MAKKTSDLSLRANKTVIMGQLRHDTITEESTLKSEEGEELKEEIHKNDEKRPTAHFGPLMADLDQAMSLPRK